MNKILLFLIPLFLFLQQSQAQEMARIVRWKSPVTGDFESMPEGRHTDTQLQSWGYTNKTYQYSAYKEYPTYVGCRATLVYRWTMPNCRGSIMFGANELSDAQLQSWGYKDKEFQFYACQNKPATGDFVAVNRWINAKPQGDPCRDFTLTVAETEFTDAQLISYGYKDKKTQFWIPRPINRQFREFEIVPAFTYNNQNSVAANSVSLFNQMVEYLPFAVEHCSSSFDTFKVSASGYSQASWSGSIKEYVLKEYIGKEKRVMQFVLNQRRNGINQEVTYRIYEKSGKIELTYQPIGGQITLIRNVGIVRQSNSYTLSWQANGLAVSMVFTKQKGYYIC